MRRVIIESPYAGDVKIHVEYAKRCLRDSIERGEAPFASHLLYTQVLDDSLLHHREQGMAAGLSWTAAADAVVVYTDYGISSGMVEGMYRAQAEGVNIELRCIGKNEDPK